MSDLGISKSDCEVRTNFHQGMAEDFFSDCHPMTPNHSPNSGQLASPNLATPFAPSARSSTEFCKLKNRKDLSSDHEQKAIADHKK
ncbi:MAG: hypothetical protein DMG61_21110 [Acidobacteria bacterium]|nr:MAG: hypothetical protein DMG61_21110 [Acidobacteriota bacterium]